MNCTRCEGTGFLNNHQIPSEILDRGHEAVLSWLHNLKVATDVQVCDCCGDGEYWYSEAGEHDEADFGDYGPYGYNGGLPECW